MIYISLYENENHSKIKLTKPLTLIIDKCEIVL